MDGWTDVLVSSDKYFLLQQEVSFWMHLEVWESSQELPLSRYGVLDRWSLFLDAVEKKKKKNK